MIHSVLLVLERSSTNTATEQFHDFYRPKMVFTGEKSAYIITINVSFVARSQL